MERELLLWIKICITISALILLVVGFTIGYLIGDDSCKQNPLRYGVEKLNKANNDSFFCSCASGKYPQPIYFDENGLKESTSGQNDFPSHLIYPVFSETP